MIETIDRLHNLARGGYLQCRVVMHRAGLPGWLVDEMAEVESDAELDQIAMVLLCDATLPADDALCIVRLDNFLDLWK